MFTWILIIGGVLLLAGIVWTALGKGGKPVDHADVRRAKIRNAGKGDYHGGAGL
ncbi:hypothetical protein ACIO3S_12970 [Nocardioides sp. NPDC087217]|uniref:hypothetical protein n=1 Tax=Nocardioides sp. NPDC087217 TaxID=3364335 RepID=UPI00381E5F0F